MIQKLTKTTESTLQYFFQNPTEEIHIRGLADKTDIPYSSVRNALKQLEEQNLVKTRKEAKMTFYSANLENKEFQQKKRIYNIQKLYESNIVETLEKEFRPDSIVLFGSYLQGTDQEDSDIDITIINGRDTEINLKKYEKKLGRNLQFIHIEDAREEGEEFQNTLANGYVLKGHLTLV